MLGTQNLLREEMKEKEFFREQAASAMQQLVKLQGESATRIKELETDAQRRELEVNMIEEKNAKMLEKIGTITKLQEDTERDSNIYKAQVQAKD